MTTEQQLLHLENQVGTLRRDLMEGLERLTKEGVGVEEKEEQLKALTDLIARVDQVVNFGPLRRELMEGLQGLAEEQVDVKEKEEQRKALTDLIATCDQVAKDYVKKHQPTSSSQIEETSLRDQLDEALDNLREAEVEVEKEKAQIKALTELVTKIDQVVDDYVKKHPELKTKQNEHETFYTEERECLRNACKDIADKICEKAQEATNEIETLKSEIDGKIEEEQTGSEEGEGLKSQLEKAKQLRERKKKDRDEAKQLFEIWMSPVKSIDARLKALDQLRKNIFKEHDEKSIAYAYYLLDCAGGFHDRLTGSPEVVGNDGIRSRINESWENYKNKEKLFYDQDAEVKKLETQLETKQTQLDDAEKTLEETIRSKLKELQNLNKQQTKSA